VTGQENCDLLIQVTT